MIAKTLDIIYNKKYLVIVPEKSIELLDSIEYSLGNVIIMTKNVEDKKYIIEFIRQNNFGKIVFIDYQEGYKEIIESLTRKTKVYFCFTKSLAAFSDPEIYETYKKMYNLYKNSENSILGVLDNGLYECLKNNNEATKKILLDYPRNTKKNKEKIIKSTIGLLNEDNNPQHSFYNELSAIKLLEKAKVNVHKINSVTKKFLKDFSISFNKYNNIDLTLNKSEINLYINFTNNNNILFLRSMDNGIPCILGNNTILDENEYLKKALVMKSDDDVNEIAEKIIYARNNKDKIIIEYEKFRDNYSLESKKSIEEFLEEKIEKSIAKPRKKQPLITVVVPVYNTAKYLKKALNSILDAGINDMEILIINDGSTDNSEKIITKYQKSFPKLIRYIKQKNHGLGSVRNIALKEARGKYIASIDSDDTIDVDFFESALKYLEEDVDIVVYNWLTISSEKKYSTAASDWIFNNEKWNRYEALLYTSIMPSTCNKIIKKKLFDDLKIKYIEDKYEDLSTNPFVLLKAETIKYIDKDYYRYYIRSGSIMRTKPGYSMIDVLNLFNDRLEKYKYLINVDIDDFKYYTYSWRIEELVLNQLYTIEETEIKEFTKYLNKNFKETMLEIFNNPRYIEMLEKLPKEYREYIENRNKAIKSNKLEKFIKEARKEEKYFKLTPQIIYYGYNK